MRGIALDLGISHETLRRWMEHGTSTFRRVAVREASAGAASGESSLVVLLPCGVRVEGMDVASLAELARRLS